MDHTHENDPEYVTARHYEATIEGMQREINRLSHRLDTIERDMHYKADERHCHREYADERHYH